MTDEELVRSFEAGTEPPGGFHHAERVRVAWWYLRREPLEHALARFKDRLKHLAAAQNASGLYHETITVAFVLLVNARLSGDGREGSWDGADFRALMPRPAGGRHSRHRLHSWAITAADSGSCDPKDPHRPRTEFHLYCSNRPAATLGKCLPARARAGSRRLAAPARSPLGRVAPPPDTRRKRAARRTSVPETHRQVLAAPASRYW
jgi:hypothetical protein